MGNEPTKHDPQALFNYWTDDTVNPPTLVVGNLYWNGTAWSRATTDTNGNIGGKTILQVTGSGSATATLVSAVASKRIKVIAFGLYTFATTAVTVTFKSGAGGTALWTVPLQAISQTITGANLSIPAPSFLFATAAGALLELSFSAAQTVIYNISYFADDAT